MHYFVSYSRRDNDSRSLLHVKELLLARGANSVYVDDLETHASGVDRVETLVDALSRAKVFCAIHSPGYLGTAWTSWEFNFAVTNGVQIISVSPDGSFIYPSSPDWPWLDIVDGETYKHSQSGLRSIEKPTAALQHATEIASRLTFLPDSRTGGLA
ncbi:toll/interleukin-1 receptor domain-containing protein [Streptomyces microflavus]|uniref:toll/interleukin-1 receptor domain-containing protein n=1 Tax=Streptomyces microflavus TaxID=1919 RepID=UPI00344157FB